MHTNAKRPTRSELTGTFIRTRHRWDATIVGDISPRPGEDADQDMFHRGATVKGPDPDEELENGESYRFYGRWQQTQYGKQFVFQTFVRVQPLHRQGIVAYLATAKWIGPKRAELLWGKFGQEAVAKLREQPAEAAGVCQGLSVEQAEEAAAELRDRRATEESHIELIGLLDKRGFPKKLAKDCLKEWGNRAARLIERNPYLLQKFRGVGFLRCDKLYLDLGLPPERLKRQAYAVTYEISTDQQGHTWFSADWAANALQKWVSGAGLRPVDALRLAKRGRLISVHRDHRNRPWVADAGKAEAEAIVAGCVAHAMTGDRPSKWPEVTQLVGLSAHQRTQLERAISGQWGLLTGSPGTGKTYTVAALARQIIAQYGEGSIAVAAPTGKAAVRATEAMKGYGLPIEATTIHRLLGVLKGGGSGEWSFEHDETNPLPYQFVVVDEASMIDTNLAASLLRAIARGTHLLIVGDPHQLPPVGHGAPLRDLITAKMPCGKLTEIRRNSGAIVLACAAIRDTGRFRAGAKVDLENGMNLKLVECRGAEQQKEKIIAAIRAAGGDHDPVWDVQVLAAVNQRSELSRAALNKMLQAELNPHGQGAAGSPFKTGDKVVCLKNGFYKEYRDPDNVDRSDDDPDETEPEHFVANGELGSVAEVREKLTIIRVGNKLLKVPRGGSTSEDGKSDDSSGSGCDWDLGYCLSTHKSQGSEWPVVIVVLDDYLGARAVCSREWIYTAISRAKTLCLLVGQQATADGFCTREALPLRQTFLCELIDTERAKLTESIPQEIGAD